MDADWILKAVLFARNSSTGSAARRTAPRSPGTGAMEAILTWGTSIALELQAASSPVLDGAFLWITQLGGEQFFLLLVPLVYWCLDKRLGLRLAYLYMFSVLANLWMKALFAAPRPYQYDSRVRLVGPAQTQPGFPSGHAQSATAVWGLLGLRVRRNGMWWLAAVVVSLVSVSRVYLGVHFPHDVAAGVLLGVIAVVVFVRVEPVLSDRLATLSFGAKIVTSAVAPIALLAVLVDRDTVAVTGALSGLSIGFVLQQRWAAFAVAGSLRQRAMRFVLGAVGLVAVYLGLRAVFGAIVSQEETALWYLLRFLRYALVGLWAGGLWPMIAVRFGLAPREPR
ncbi:MAG: phosphatase PAP2 family protein [Burkholderiales bacterium]|nr:MAG: phosphatase PAP2 family protein [Burkholderiales bacterium]